MIGTILAATGAVGIFAFIKAYRYVHEYRNVFKEMGLHELPEKSWAGGWILFMQENKDLFQLELDLIKEHGKVFGYFEGRYPVIMAADIDFLRQVMIKDHEHFVDRRNAFPSRKSPMNLQLSALTGQRWKHVRQQLTPTFTPANLRRMEPLLKKVADQLAANIGRQADEGKSFDVKDFSGYYTLDVIASVAFALEIDSFNTQDSPFVSKSKAIFQTVPLTSKFLAFMLMFPDWLSKVMNSVPIWSEVVEHFKFFERVIANEMDRRKKTEGNVQRYDFLAQVMPLEKKPEDPANKAYLEYDELGGVWLRNGLTGDEIIGQSLFFFLAGYESTASTLTYTLMALSQNPDVQEKLYRELVAQFGNGKPLTGDALNEVKYLEMVINEVLRCYTPLLRVDRICTSETTVNGLRIPKDVVIIIPVNAVHHDPDLWPEPHKFDPERFSPENADRIPPLAFIPFGSGNRNCIGMRLAMTELKVAVAKLILDFKFSISPETDLPIRWIPTFFRTPHCKIMLQPERRGAVSTK